MPNPKTLVVLYTPDGMLEGMGKCGQCGSSLAAAGKDYVCLGHLEPEEMLAASLEPQFNEEGDVIGASRLEPCCSEKHPQEQSFNIDLEGLRKAGFDPELTIAAAKRFGTFVKTLPEGSTESKDLKRNCEKCQTEMIYCGPMVSAGGFETAKALLSIDPGPCPECNGKSHGKKLNDDGTVRTNWFCESCKVQTHVNVPFEDWWAFSQDTGPGLDISMPPPNKHDWCPCGSRKKYGKCCGKQR